MQGVIEADLHIASICMPVSGVDWVQECIDERYAEKVMRRMQ